MLVCGLPLYLLEISLIKMHLGRRWGVNMWHVFPPFNFRAGESRSFFLWPNSDSIATQSRLNVPIMSHYSCFLPELRPAGVAGPLFGQSGMQSLEDQSSSVKGLLVSLCWKGLCEQTALRKALGCQTVLCGLQLPYQHRGTSLHWHLWHLSARRLWW